VAAFCSERRDVTVSLRKLQKMKYFSIGGISESSQAEREEKESEKEVKRSFWLILEVWSL